MAPIGGHEEPDRGQGPGPDGRQSDRGWGHRRGDIGGAQGVQGLGNGHVHPDEVRHSIGSASVDWSDERGMYVRGGGAGGQGPAERWHGREGSRGDNAGMDRWGSTNYGAGAYGGSGAGRGGDYDDRSPVGTSGARVSQGHRGRGPRGYTRSDERIREDIGDRLTDHPGIDASDIEILVTGGEVTLTGTVDQRTIKHAVEDLVEGVTGVTEIHNQLRVRRPGAGSREGAVKP